MHVCQRRTKEDDNGIGHNQEAARRQQNTETAKPTDEQGPIIGQRGEEQDETERQQDNDERRVVKRQKYGDTQEQ